MIHLDCSKKVSSKLQGCFYYPRNASNCNTSEEEGFFLLYLHFQNPTKPPQKGTHTHSHAISYSHTHTHTHTSTSVAQLTKQVHINTFSNFLAFFTKNDVLGSSMRFALLIFKLACRISFTARRVIFLHSLFINLLSMLALRLFFYLVLRDEYKTPLHNCCTPRRRLHTEPLLQRASKQTNSPRQSKSYLIATATRLPSRKPGPGKLNSEKPNPRSTGNYGDKARQL